MGRGARALLRHRIAVLQPPLMQPGASEGGDAVGDIAAGAVRGPDLEQQMDLAEQVAIGSRDGDVVQADVALMRREHSTLPPLNSMAVKPWPARSSAREEKRTSKRPKWNPGMVRASQSTRSVSAGVIRSRPSRKAAPLQ